MSTNAGDLHSGVVSAGSKGFSPYASIVTPFLKTAVPLLTIIFGLFVLTYWYQTWAAWLYGLDATTAEFEQYWMQWFYIETVVIWSSSFLVWAWIWVKRDKNVASVAPAEELRRYMSFIGLISAYVLALYFAASFFAEQDGSWHMTVVRDTSFTPTHIMLFYGWFPLYILFGGAVLLYSVTQLPVYAKNLSVMILMAVLGPFLILPNVAYNEWGHAFWISEEIFSLPLHWGFVIFGWAALAFGGLLAQVLNRLMVLIPKVIEEQS